MFVRVVEGGSFVSAARRLGVSKSVITKRVKELEDRLKAQLLVRSTRRLTLTDAGASYFERCARVVAELDEAQSAVRSMTVGLSGTLRLSCIASFLAHQLSRDVCRFQQQHPELLIELITTIASTIRSRKATTSASSRARSADRTSSVSRSSNCGGCSCGAGLFRAPRPAGHPGELASHRFAHNNYILPIGDITFTGPTGTVRTPPIRPVVLSNSIWMIREAALSGDYVSILPIYSIVDELKKRRAGPGVRSLHGAVGRAERVLSPLAASARQGAHAAQIPDRAIRRPAALGATPGLRPASPAANSVTCGMRVVN